MLDSTPGMDCGGVRRLNWLIILLCEVLEDNTLHVVDGSVQAIPDRYMSV